MFQCNFSAEWVRQEATEWSDKAVGRLGSVWGPLRGRGRGRDENKNWNSPLLLL